MLRRMTFVLSSLALVVSAASALAQDDREYTTDFRLDECEFTDRGRNTYFNLNPGYTLVLEGEDDGALLRVRIKVLNRTKVIRFRYKGQRLEVTTRIIEEREWEDGELVEVSRNYFAMCRRTGNVYYFGEAVDNYEDGELVDHEGAWRAGRDGAMPGLIMPSVFTLGARYFQEIAPEDDAMDQARHMAMGLTVETEAGTFEDCIKIVETSPLEPGDVSIKIYAPNVGMIFDDGIELVSRSR